MYSASTTHTHTITYLTCFTYAYQSIKTLRTVTRTWWTCDLIIIPWENATPNTTNNNNNTNQQINQIIWQFFNEMVSTIFQRQHNRTAPALIVTFCVRSLCFVSCISWKKIENENVKNNYGNILRYFDYLCHQQRFRVLCYVND